MIYTIADLIGSEDCKSGPDQSGRWSRSVPLPFYGDYIRAAWKVFRGDAVAVQYPKSGDLELALAKSGGIHVEPL